MPSVIVVGGGLAGLAAAAALGSGGYGVDLFESRSFLGGRATSYEVPTGPDTTTVIDNCQHVLLRCCVNLIDFYQRLGVSDAIEFYREFNFIEPGGRLSTLRSGNLPAPLHFTESFLGLKCFTLVEKLALGRGLLALRQEWKARKDLDRITMLDWLREKSQPARVIERFWRPVLVSAINEDLERLAAQHGFQVFWLGFLARKDSYEMGIPKVPLTELYSSEAWRTLPTVRIHTRSTVERITKEGAMVNGNLLSADAYVVALPFERLRAVIPEIPLPALQHSPITGIHLWFDESITDLPHATLLDRTIQWMFNKREGKHIQLVVSASRSFTGMSRQEVIEVALRELIEFFPKAGTVRLLRAHVVKEVRATFSALPGLENVRPVATTACPGVFLAGDWTRSGWPATMEGAVRSGYLAAEAVTRYCGNPRTFLIPDIA